MGDLLLPMGAISAECEHYGSFSFSSRKYFIFSKALPKISTCVGWRLIHPLIHPLNHPLVHSPHRTRGRHKRLTKPPTSTSHTQKKKGHAPPDLAQPTKRFSADQFSPLAITTWDLIAANQHANSLGFIGERIVRRYLLNIPASQSTPWFPIPITSSTSLHGDQFTPSVNVPERRQALSDANPGTLCS